MNIGCLVAFLTYLTLAVSTLTASQELLTDDESSNNTISPQLFSELEELARIVDISYCVGVTGLGISKPFECLSRCSEFENFELVKAWNTGPLLSDSCGYIALSHPPSPPRIIVAFRGTYSIANTIADLSTVPQKYVPYPGDDDDDEDHPTFKHIFNRLRNTDDETPPANPPKCENCTVHMGFYSSWLNTRNEILEDLSEALHAHPNYTLTMVGHSLGGAVSTLASLDLMARGWSPKLTTFGEPRLGNAALMKYIDNRFDLSSSPDTIQPNSSLRRVTHDGDPVPLLPLDEWGYRMHAGEVFISKRDLPPNVTDMHHCIGDEDPNCIAGLDETVIDARDRLEGTDESQSIMKVLNEESKRLFENDDQLDTNWWESASAHTKWPIPSRFKLWELFFAHRDYFWRLGLCAPGGDPKDWYRKPYPTPGDGDVGEDRPEL